MRFEVDVFFLVVKIVLQDVLLHLNKVFCAWTLTLQVANNEGHHILCMTTISHFIVTSIEFFPFIHIILVHIFLELLFTNFLCSFASCAWRFHILQELPLGFPFFLSDNFFFIWHKVLGGISLLDLCIYDESQRFN